MVFAHQGGWDEFLLVLAPIIVFGSLLAVAKRRADREAADEGTEAGRRGGSSLGDDVGTE